MGTTRLQDKISDLKLCNYDKPVLLTFSSTKKQLLKNEHKVLLEELGSLKVKILVLFLVFHQLCEF